MDEEIATIVREHGWFGANVNDADPPFFYSIGLMAMHRHPELIVFGLEPDNAYALISQLVANIRSGMSYSQVQVVRVTIGEEEHCVGFRSVHPTQHELYLGFAMGFLTNIGRMGELQAIQAFWPDRNGKFPFDAGCELGVYELQPRLDIGLSLRDQHKFRRQFD